MHVQAQRTSSPKWAYYLSPTINHAISLAPPLSRARKVADRPTGRWPQATVRYHCGKDSNKFTEKQRQRDVARGREVNALAAKLAAKYNGPVRKQSDVSTKPTAIADPPLLCPKHCRCIFSTLLKSLPMSLAPPAWSPFSFKPDTSYVKRLVSSRLLGIRRPILQTNRRATSYGKQNISRTDCNLRSSVPTSNQACVTWKMSTTRPVVTGRIDQEFTTAASELPTSHWVNSTLCLLYLDSKHR